MNWPLSTIAPQALRSEIFQLGGRHFGEPLAGAMLELADVSISRDRRRLLEAVVRELRPDETASRA